MQQFRAVQRNPRETTYDTKDFVWSLVDAGVFQATAPQFGTMLPAGIYEYFVDMRGMEFFIKKPIERPEKLIEFPGKVGEILAELQFFYSPETRTAYSDYGMPYKRGILLYGPPGSGKSVILNLVLGQVVQAGGIGVLVSGGVRQIAAAYKYLRKVEPDRNVIMVVEDLDTSMAGPRGEAEFTNVLDGVDTNLHGIVIVATTNYIEKLPPRLVNRPGRFDKTFYIGPPSESIRLHYLRQLFEKLRQHPENQDIEKWAKDTKGLSLAHIKELFIQVMLLRNDYAKVIHRMKSESVGGEGAEEDYDERRNPGHKSPRKCNCKALQAESHQDDWGSGIYGKSLRY
jgi:energy-coupling factor transporter ATP-binding protein EcfA2